MMMMMMTLFCIRLNNIRKLNTKYKKTKNKTKTKQNKP